MGDLKRVFRRQQTSTGWVEAHIVAAQSQGCAGAALPELPPQPRLAKPSRLTEEDAKCPETVALRLILALLWRDDGRALLRDGGIKDKFEEKHNRTLC